MDEQRLAVSRELRAEAKRKRLSARELARMAGMSPTTVSAVLKGTASTTVGSLVRIADALGLSVEFTFRERAKEGPVRVEKSTSVVFTPHPSASNKPGR